MTRSPSTADVVREVGPATLDEPPADRRSTASDAAVMNRPSTKPFGVALRALMDRRGLSFRGLAEATRGLDGRGITHAHINTLANGHDRPSMRAMELIARACEVQPDYFAEYRLRAAMRELDPAEVGLERALEELNARLGGRGHNDARG
jgi:transcriptional regulator with XRE-family HTH domain